MCHSPCHRVHWADIQIMWLLCWNSNAFMAYLCYILLSFPTTRTLLSLRLKLCLTSFNIFHSSRPLIIQFLGHLLYIFSLLLFPGCLLPLWCGALRIIPSFRSTTSMSIVTSHPQNGSIRCGQVCALAFYPSFWK